MRWLRDPMVSFPLGVDDFLMLKDGEAGAVTAILLLLLFNFFDRTEDCPPERCQAHQTVVAVAVKE